MYCPCCGHSLGWDGWWYCYDCGQFTAHLPSEGTTQEQLREEWRKIQEQRRKVMA